MELEKAVFGAGCFWGPDALFGSLEGVVRTRVGYAGGSKESPGYRNLGDHTEVVLVEFDSSVISYKDLLKVFWESHDYSSRRKKQYASKILYLSEKQRHEAENSIDKHNDASTVLQELDKFYIAENYHQKYRLRNSDMFEEFKSMGSEQFRDSSLAAKANGFVAGYLTREEYENYVESLD